MQCVRIVDGVKVMRTIIKTYSDLIKIPTFEERYEYLRLGGAVGRETFGYDRYLNQRFYKSKEWLSLRDKIIVRDHGCDLAVDGYDIYGKIIVHHLNPILIGDIQDNTEILMNPEYLITTTLLTHNAIHFGTSDLLPKEPITRYKNDTCPWKLTEG